MKKNRWQIMLTGLLFSLIGLNNNANAQCAIDTNFNHVGYYPTELDTAYVDSFYSQIIQFKFPEDTLVFNNRIKFDSFKIESINGLPPGFSYDCDTPSCVYPGGGQGCVSLEGMPLDSMVGVYKVNVKVRGYVFNFSQAQTEERDLVIIEAKIDTTNDTSTTLVQKINFNQNIKIYPNPVNSKSIITFYSDQADFGNFQIINVNGALVESRSFSIKQGKNLIAFRNNNLPSGLYVFKITLQNKTLIGKFFVDY